MDNVFVINRVKIMLGWEKSSCILKKMKLMDYVVK